MNYKRKLITAALPYANGPLHIGHITGAYLPADLYVRHCRLKNRDVKFICGSDEHGVPITIKALKENKTPQEVVDMYHNHMKKTFEDMHISFDIYSRTSNNTHHKLSQEFFLKLYNDGILEEKESLQLYDSEVNMFLADRYITGICPKCNADGAYGDQCEKCGSTLSPDELISPKSTISGSVPIKKSTKHWYLPLKKYQAYLEKWILEEHTEWKMNVYGQCKSWLQDGLESRAVTRDLSWGVPVPLPNCEGKVLYVWFDAPIGYISATKELLGKSYKDYWQQEDTELIHFIGKDNIVFHCIIFPAMLLAHGNYVLPSNVPANEFLNLEGKKLSTSRNYAVWAHEFLADLDGNADIIRYYLTATMPENKDTNFTFDGLKERINGELVDTLGNLINRVISLYHRYYNGIVPASDVDMTIINEVNKLMNEVSVSIDSYRFKEALEAFMDTARVINRYLTAEEPWKIVKHSPEKALIILNTALQGIAKIQVMMRIFMPSSADTLAHMIAMKDMDYDTAISANTIITAQTQLLEPQFLFNKIDDEQINTMRNRLDIL